MQNKIITRDAAGEILKGLKKQGKSIVMTNGCFDILHRGHVAYLEEAKAMGDVLVVAVNTDSSVKSYKGEDRPINHEDDRAFVLAGLGCVDYVFLFEERLPVQNIEVCQPDIFVKGGDYTVEQLPEAQTVFDHGGEVRLIDFVDGFSTTSVIKRMQDLTK